MTIPIKIKLLCSEARGPERGTAGAAGLDVFAHFGPGALEHMDFKAGDVKKVPLGFAMELPETHHVNIEGRSGNNLQGDFSVETGTIDSDYRGEVCATVRAHRDFKMVSGFKVAQMLLRRTEFERISVVEELSKTKRGSQGFGSTGQ